MIIHQAFPIGLTRQRIPTKIFTMFNTPLCVNTQLSISNLAKMLQPLNGIRECVCACLHKLWYDACGRLKYIPYLTFFVFVVSFCRRQQCIINISANVLNELKKWYFVQFYKDYQMIKRICRFFCSCRRDR